METKKIEKESFGKFEIEAELSQRQLEVWDDYIYQAELDKHGLSYRNRKFVEAACKAGILKGDTVKDWLLDAKPALIAWLCNEIAVVINATREIPKN